MLESPIAKPFPQFTSFFIAVGLPNTIQHNIPKKRGPIIASLIACLLGTLDSPSAVTRQTLEQPYPLGIEQATPNAYQLIALCRGNMLTPSYTQVLLNLKETLSPGKQG